MSMHRTIDKAPRKQIYPRRRHPGRPWVKDQKSENQEKGMRQYLAAFLLKTKWESFSWVILTDHSQVCGFVNIQSWSGVTKSDAALPSLGVYLTDSKLNHLHWADGARGIVWSATWRIKSQDSAVEGRKPSPYTRSTLHWILKRLMIGGNRGERMKARGKCSWRSCVLSY